MVFFPVGRHVDDGVIGYGVGQDGRHEKQRDQKEQDNLFHRDSPFPPTFYHGVGGGATGREVNGMAFIAEFYKQPKVKPLALALIAAAAAEGASLHDLEEAYTVVIQEYRHAIKRSGEIITQFRGEVEGSFERAEKEIEAVGRRRTGITGEEV